MQRVGAAAPISTQTGAAVLTSDDTIEQIRNSLLVLVVRGEHGRHETLRDEACWSNSDIETVFLQLHLHVDLGSEAGAGDVEKRSDDRKLGETTVAREAVHLCE